MNIVVISSTDKFHSEINSVVKLFEAGLEVFHIRKPKFGREKMEEYIKLIPKKYHSQIVIHTHHALAKKYKLMGVHLTRKHRKRKWQTSWRIRMMKMRNPKFVVTRSFHKLSDILDEKRKYNYVFLTPIYEGISKKSHSGGFSKRALMKALENSVSPVFGLGGISADKIEDLKQLGFAGAALLGSIWAEDANPIQVFEACEDKALGLKSFASANAE